MDHQTGTGRRQFLKRASLLVAGTQAGALLPSAAAAAIPGAAKQAKPLSGAKGSDPVVDTSSGKVRGTVHDGIRVFKGIPYGASPAGKNRFMPPNKPAPWSGVREATAFGHSAPQPQWAGPYDFLRIIDWITIPGHAEDCLVLNVWTRAVKDNAKRPVLVSFHGSGFALGSGSHILLQRSSAREVRRRRCGHAESSARVSRVLEHGRRWRSTGQMADFQGRRWRSCVVSRRPIVLAGVPTAGRPDNGDPPRDHDEFCCCEVDTAL